MNLKENIKQVLEKATEPMLTCHIKDKCNFNFYKSKINDKADIVKTRNTLASMEKSGVVKRTEESNQANIFWELVA